MIGDHHAQLTRPVRFVLDRRFQPAVLARTHHQSGLIVLMGGCCENPRADFAVPLDFGVKEMPVVGAESIMGTLPEVRFAAGFHYQSRPDCIHPPGRRRIQPFESRMEVFSLKRLVDREMFHGVARYHRTFDHDY